MTATESRYIVLKRLTKEIIGPGSDIFICKDDFTDEIIEGKPLQRYFSAILFPKQVQNNSEDKGENELIDDDTAEELDDIEIKNTDNSDEKQSEESEEDDNDKTNTQPKYTSNSFFPSHYGITFSIAENCKAFKVEINFGTYIRAKYEEIKLPYHGGEVHYLSKHGIEQFVSFDPENKILFQPTKLQRIQNKQLNPDWIIFTDAIKSLKKETSNDLALIKSINKLFFKDKYKRVNHKIETEINIDSIIGADNNHLEMKIADLPNNDFENLPKELKENLKLHLRYSKHNGKHFVKIVLENQCQIEKKSFTISKEKVNQISCFQTEIKIFCDDLLEFRDYQKHQFKTDEDQMLDYLYRDKLAFGIGHNAS